MFSAFAKRTFLSFTIHPGDDSVLTALDAALRAAPDAPPSQVVGGMLEWLFEDGHIPESCREDFLYAIDAMQDWMFLLDPSSPTQRRSRHPRERARRIRWIAFSFANDATLAQPVEAFLTNPDMRVQRRADIAAERSPSALHDRLNAAIARDRRIAGLVEARLADCSDWRMNYLVPAALRSRESALHEAVARRAAQMQPQEASWFAQCDLGRREALVTVLRAIADSDVMDRGDVFGHGYAAEVVEQITRLYCVRFSSPIPANQHHLQNRHGNGATMKAIAHIRDYIAPDTVRTALRCLTEPDFRAGCLHSEDGVRIHLALWAMGAENDQSALDMADALIETGTPAQRLAACLFVQQGCLTWAADRFTPGQDMGRWLNKAVRLHPEEKELLAVCMPPALVRTDEPEALSWWFADESEARATFETYMTLAGTLEKKETFEGCGYRWLKVHLLCSDAARNACTLAGLLRDDALIDRACAILKQVGSEDRYGVTLFLCREPRTEVQRKAFFGLMCDRDPGMRAIHRRRVTAQYQPTPADAPALENFLTAKYDDTRAEVLRLLLLLPEDALRESIRRLCASRKEALRTAGEALRAKTFP